MHSPAQIKVLQGIRKYTAPKVAARDAPENWEDWLSELFPSAFTFPHAPHHREYWEWVWAIKRDARPRPYIFVLAREGGKTTGGEITPISLLSRGIRKYTWYIQETQDQADKRVVNIADRLESDAFAQYYPEMSERKIGKFGSSKGWRRNFVRTSSSAVFEAVGLDKAARSSKVGDARPDVLIIDDVDAKNDSPEAVQKKINTLKYTLLPAATADAVVIFIQNLIHYNSMASQLVGNEADFLLDRIVSGPYPALRDFDYEVRYDHEVGRNRTFITSGTPTWEGQSVEKCQQIINKSGLDSFRVECQHEVHLRKGVVYDTFTDENITDLEPDPFLPTGLAFDDGYYPDPRVILFLQQTPDYILVFDEIYHNRHLAETCVNETVDRFKLGWPLNPISLDDFKNMDRLDEIEHRKDGLHYVKTGLALPEIAVGDNVQEMIKRFRQANIPARSGKHTPITDGIDKVRNFICNDGGERRLLVHKRCERFIKEMSVLYKYPEGGKRGDIPVDADNHGPDAIRYYIWLKGRG